MRKMLKLIKENRLFFFDALFLIGCLVATVFIPAMVYSLYIVYFFTIMDVYLMVEDKVCKVFQIVTLLVCVMCVLVGHVQNVAAMMYIMHPLAIMVWICEYIVYLKIMKFRKG